MCRIKFSTRGIVKKHPEANLMKLRLLTVSDFFCYVTYEMCGQVNSKINVTPQLGCFKK